MRSDVMISSPDEVVSKQRRRPGVIDLPFSLLLVPVMFLVAGLSVPIVMCAAVLQSRAEKRYAEAKRREGRLVKYEDIRAAAIASEGTLVVEKLSLKGPWRFWWTSDDLRQLSPVTLPATDDQEDLIEVENAFQAWFSERYIDVENGAYLVDRSVIPRGRIDEELKTVPHLSFEHWPAR